MDIVAQLDFGPMEMDKISGQAGIILLVFFFFHSSFLKDVKFFCGMLLRTSFSVSIRLFQILLFYFRS